MYRIESGAVQNLYIIDSSRNKKESLFQLSFLKKAEGEGFKPPCSNDLIAESGGFSPCYGLRASESFTLRTFHDLSV